jgi:8-oxo-dGTP diphosphatase
MMPILSKPSRTRVAIIMIDGDQILLIHRYKYGREYYIIPGGGVESGETLEQTALREAKEETGLDIVLDRKLWEYINKGHPEHYFLAAQFSGNLGLGGPELAEQSAENIFQLEWVRLNELKALPLLPEFAKEKIIAELSRIER